MFVQVTLSVMYYFTVDKLSSVDLDVTNEVGSNAGRIGCGVNIRGYGPGGVRSGHFDTRSTTWRHQCVIHLIGTPSDVVQVSLFNYNLR